MDHCSLVSLKLEKHCTNVANFSIEIFVKVLNGEKILLQKILTIYFPLQFLWVPTCQTLTFAFY